MAFSTQKDFLHMSFTDLPFGRKKSEIKLKTYESCTDARAWSMDSTKRAKYLEDILQNVRMRKHDGSGDTSRFFTREELEAMSQEELIDHILSLYKNIQVKNNELKATEQLLHDASKKFESIDKVIQENKELQNEVEASKERLKTIEIERQELQKKLKHDKQAINDRLSQELLDKSAKVNDLMSENTNLKGQLTNAQSSLNEITELRRRSEILDRVMEERNNLLDKLQQAEGIEDAILKLKEKAMLADRLSEENKKMCQLLQNMKQRLKEEIGDGPKSKMAKMLAENRYLNDKISQVDALEEEIAIYKAKNFELSRKAEDFRQKLVQARHFEMELHDTVEELQRKEAEVEDCENVIQRCMVTIERQDRENKLACMRLKELCKMQQDIQMLHEHVGITYVEGPTDEICRKPNVCDAATDPCEKREVCDAKTDPCEKREVCDATTQDQKCDPTRRGGEDVDSVGEIDTSRMREPLATSSRIDVKKMEEKVNDYENKIKSLEDQLENCRKKLVKMEESYEEARGLKEQPNQSSSTKEKPNTTQPSVLDTSHAECKQEIDRLMAEIEACKKQKNEITQQLDTKAKQFADLENNMTKLKEEVQIKSDALKEAVQKDTSATSKESDISALQNELDALRKENNLLKNETNTLKESINKITKEKDDALKNSEAFQSQINQLKSETDECKAKVVKMEAEKDVINSQLSEAKALVDKFSDVKTDNNALENARIAELENEIQRLNDQLVKEMAKTKDLEASLDVARLEGAQEIKPVEIQVPSNVPIEVQVPSNVPIEQDADVASLKGQIESLRAENIKLKKQLEECHKHISEMKISDPARDKLRESYKSDLSLLNERYSNHIKSFQELHDCEKEELARKHEAEMDAMRLQIEALRDQLHKIDARCKCGIKKPLPLFNTDERLAKICRDVQEFGLDPCTLPDLFYLREETSKAIKKKQNFAQHGVEHTDNLSDLMTELQDALGPMCQQARNLRELADVDHIPVKLPKPSPITSGFPTDKSEATGRRNKSQPRASSVSTSEGTKPRISRPSTSRNISKTKPGSSAQTRILYHHGNKLLKITDRPEPVPSNSRKNPKQL